MTRLAEATAGVLGPVAATALEANTTNESQRATVRVVMQARPFGAQR
jgi:hypothetical protein